MDESVAVTGLLVVMKILVMKLCGQKLNLKAELKNPG
jgi:hypothetical protein